MFNIFRTSSFKSDYKKLDDIEKELLKMILQSLIYDDTLDKKYKNHPLIGNYKGCMECHIKPDLLLIYKIDIDLNELQLVRIGSHSQLFR
ncbi:Addiction module toxin, RelE/StbE family [Sulfurovum sp. enrichment culture clone C5]|uniref:Addiction module toxin, RelE/StbE family n=1 Tax=Sulfurovum sp. enrichment culture clone C5 TaxID=497650 RepID=A0A0S4XLD0_9BACT|nr:Addiction module toxin, RelE/StbE family [Sulfurovum sp. enrichment culture clone C5]